MALLDGGIAQLGEHLLCKQGVNGSIPFISTTPSNLRFAGGPIRDLTSSAEINSACGKCFALQNIFTRHLARPVCDGSLHGPIAQLARAHD